MQQRYVPSTTSDRRFKALPAFALAFGLTLLAACQSPSQKQVQAPTPAEPIAQEPLPAAPPPPSRALSREEPSLDQIVVTGSRVGAVDAERAYRAAPSPSAVAPSAPLMSIAPEVNRETYAEIDSNGVLRVAEQPVSTFSIDVDTGAYSNIRRMLQAGQRPPSDAVRIEELINYFSYDYTPPRAGDAPFAFATELAPSPFHSKRLLLQVALQAQALEAKDLPPANLVFLIDTSGSMFSPTSCPCSSAASPCW
jgi:Ca-activated chloride channel homolog